MYPVARPHLPVRLSIAKESRLIMSECISIAKKELFRIFQYLIQPILSLWTEFRNFLIGILALILKGKMASLFRYLKV